MSMRQRFLLFVYGNGNILGCLFGLVGLGLFFSGLIKLYWLAIVAGLYLLGYLVAPTNRRLDLKMDSQLTGQAILEAVDDLLKKVRKKAPLEILKILESIRSSLSEILPRFDENLGNLYDSHVIRQTALEYLPKMLETYCYLPPAFARLHPVKDGKTATKILAEQLELLDREMKSLLEDTLRNDTQALIAHGTFLKEKFATPEAEWLAIR